MTNVLKARVRDVVAITERALGGSFTLEVVRRENAQIWRNQILVSDGQQEFLLTVTKSRKPRRK